MYAPDWKAWFPKEGDPRHGTKDHPRMVLIGVDVHAATFLEVNQPSGKKQLLAEQGKWARFVKAIGLVMQPTDR